MPTTKEIAWLGGLLEGEASFMIRKHSPKIALQMTDLDVVQKAAAILDVPVGQYGRQPKGKSTYKTVWHLAVHGVRAIGWMMTLYQFLGERRQEKVREVIRLWLANKRVGWLQGKHRIMATCHPDRPRVAGLLCAKCHHTQWMRAYRKRTGKNGSYYRRRPVEALT